MCKEISTFRNIKTEKNKFYHHRASIFMKDVDIEKVSVFSKISFDEKKL